jgi:putative protease
VVAVDRAAGMAEVRVRNRFAPGDELEWIMPQGAWRVRLTTITATDGRALACAPGDGWMVRVPLPDQAVNAMALLARVL